MFSAMKNIPKMPLPKIEKAPTKAVNGRVSRAAKKPAEKPANGGRPKLKKPAQIIAVIGASGSGKSAFIRQELSRLKSRRVMIWDLKGEYADIAPIQPDLKAVLAEAMKPAFQIVFKPSTNEKIRREQFDWFCKIAYRAGRLVLVAEELAFVTMAAWSPAGWQEVTLLGRDKELIVYGASQRPAQVDKNFWGNATTVRTGRLNSEKDVKVMADVLQVSRLEIQNLQPLQFIERDMTNGKNISGQIHF